MLPQGGNADLPVGQQHIEGTSCTHVLPTSRIHQTCCGQNLPGLDLDLEYGQQQDAAATFLARREHILREVIIMSRGFAQF